MASRTELKIEIKRLENKVHEYRVRAEVAEKFRAQINMEHNKLMAQYNRIVKEFQILGDTWNSFSATYYRPNREDIVRGEARGELIRSLLDLLLGSNPAGVEGSLPERMRAKVAQIRKLASEIDE